MFFDHCYFIILKANANYKQVGDLSYEVACWHVQYNKISFKAINKLTLTVYSVLVRLLLATHTCTVWLLLSWFILAIFHIKFLSMLPNVKANINQQEIKDLVAVSYNFFKKYPQNLKYKRDTRKT